MESIPVLENTWELFFFFYTRTDEEDEHVVDVLFYGKPENGFGDYMKLSGYSGENVDDGT